MGTGSRTRHVHFLWHRRATPPPPNNESVLCESQGEAGDRHISASDNTDEVRAVKEIRKKRRVGERDGVNC